MEKIKLRTNIYILYRQDGDWPLDPGNWKLDPGDPM